jgi:hypothetical protein
VRWLTRVAALATVAAVGVGCGLYVSRGADVPTGHRVTGDPPVFASIEIQPEGSNPQGAAVSVLDVDVAADMPEPVETTCADGGAGVGVRLNSGRSLHYAPCAMPREIIELRDSLYRADAP